SDPGRERRRIRNPAERAVQDQVALVGHEWRAIRLQTNNRFRAEPRKVIQLTTPAKLHNLYRHGYARAELRAQLRLVYDDHLTPRGLRDNLFAQQCTPTTFDQ